MSRSGRALSIRSLLITMAVVGVAYGLVLPFEIVTVIRPAAGRVHANAGALLDEHDSIDARLQAMRHSLSQLERAFRSFRTEPARLSPAGAFALSLPVQTRLDSVVAMRTALRLGEVTSAMRLRLADAVESETSAGLTMLDAIRAMEAGEVETASAAIRDAEAQLDSTSRHLSAAQAVAVREVLDREARFLSQTQQVLRWAIGWGLFGVFLFLLGVWVVRVRLDRPLHALERAVARVSAGDLQTEVEVARADELGLLAAHFNTMTGLLRERADNEARRRENLLERFGRVLDEASNEIYFFDAATLRFVQANRGTRKNLGYTMEELAALTPLDVLRDLSAESFAAALEILRRGEQPSLRLSASQVRRDGSSYPVELTLQLSSAGDPPVFVAVVEDVTERRRIRELNERLRHFALEEHRVLSEGDLSAALRAITQMTAKALYVGRTSIWEYAPERLRCLESYEQATGEHSEGELIEATQQRQYFAALAEAGPIAAHDARRDPRTRELVAAAGPRPGVTSQLDTPVFLAGRVVAMVTQEHRGGPRRWTSEELAFGASVADLVALAMEAVERHRLQNELAQSQKMESVGRLAGGVAHDFNNLLTAILGYSEFAKSGVPASDPLYGELAEVEKAALRAADLTRQLLAFARRQVVQPVVLDLNALAQGADKLLRRLIGEDVELVTLLDPALLPVRIDPGQLEQVIVNLAINARDAMPTGGRLSIETRNVTLPGTPALPDGSASGQFVELVVSDTGVGMDPATLARVFEPFFTTKETGRGTGLGLSTCYGIARQAGGEIVITSEPGKGTRVAVRLPAVAEDPAEPSALNEHQPPPRGQETVLLVEDESQIRELATRVLRKQGYTVLTAINGEDAISQTRGRIHNIDIVVTDVVLPLMGGPELVARLHQKHPGLPVIYVSGYTGGQLPEQELATGGIAEFMPKPFTPRELARRVREVLDRN